MARILVVFYSIPVEASLTGIFRGIEVCSPDRVVIVSSRRRGSEVEELVSKLRDLYNGIDFVGYSVVPDVETSIEEIPRVVTYFRDTLKNLEYDELCFVSSAGSRIEIAALSMAIDRARTRVLYISFPWGPWKGSFYPYTPRAIEVVHEIHGIGTKPSLPQAIDIGDSLLPRSIPRLRRETLLAQHRLNLYTAETPCYASIDGFDCSCRSLEIAIVYRKTPVVEVEIRDYCSWREVVEGVDELGYRLLDLRDRVPEKAYRSFMLIARIAGIYLLTVEECSYGCNDLREYLLLDALKSMGRPALIDTCIAYSGIHNQLYEYEDAYRYLELPLCLYLELYEHQAQVGNDLYKRLRSSIASLVLEELNWWKLSIDSYAAHKPCEVGIALAKSRDRVAVTADEKAYRRLFSMLGIDSILAKPQTLRRAAFSHNENSRRVSYAYYAIAQLKALSKLLSSELRALELDIEIKTR